MQSTTIILQHGALEKEYTLLERVHFGVALRVFNLELYGRPTPEAKQTAVAAGSHLKTCFSRLSVYMHLLVVSVDRVLAMEVLESQ